MISLKLIFDRSYFTLSKTLIISLSLTCTNLEANNNIYNLNIMDIFNSKSSINNSYTLNIDQLKQFDSSLIDNNFLTSQYRSNNLLKDNNKLNIYQAVDVALQSHPDIFEKIANISQQSSNIDNAKAAYYPQISGNISSGDIFSNKLFDQVVSINAQQMIYDFGKVKNSVTIEEIKNQIEQANLLENIESLSQKVVLNIINIKRHQALLKSAQKQIQGIQRISEIAELRAKAGISSQADPVQTQSYLQSAQAYEGTQKNQLRLYQQRLSTLLATDISHVEWDIPEALLAESNLFQDIELQELPKMMIANAELELVKLQQQQVKLSTYPTFQLKGEVSQAIHGKHPVTGDENGFDSSIALRADSNFFQGGATASQIKALQYAQDAKRAQFSSLKLEVQEQTQLARQEIQFKNQHMQILLERAKTTAKTQELYEEQYKLGTRTVLDLLNAEQSIHSAAQEIENTRYDILEQLVNYIATTGQGRKVYHITTNEIQGMQILP